MTELILALSLLAPAPPPSLPAEPVNPITFQVPVNSKVIGPDGRTWTFVGTLTVTVEEPAPVPIGPTITAVRNEQGQGVEQIRSGEVLVLEGVKLWKEEASLRVQIPGRTAAVLSFSAERLRVRFPAVTAPVEGPLQVYFNEGSGWTLVATGPRITVLPAALPPPARKPVIRGLRSGVLEGEGFGAVPGQVWADWSLLPVTSWGEGQVAVTLSKGSPWYPVTLMLQTAAGEWATYGGVVGVMP